MKSVITKVNILIAILNSSLPEKVVTVFLTRINKMA